MRWLTVLAAAAAVALAPEQTVAAEVRVEVKKLNGYAPIAGATVTLVRQSNGQVVRGPQSTDAAGKTVLANVPVGLYFVRVSKPGFQTENRYCHVRAATDRILSQVFLR